MTQTESFLKYMRMVENDKLAATRDPKYIVHNSPEGGLETVGYGHKLNVLEKQTGQVYGWHIDELTVEQCDYILALDIDQRANALSQTVPSWKKRTLRDQELLVSYQFNLGSVEAAFPKFYASVLSGDIEGQRKEYKRFYRDEKGRWQELRRMNRLCYARYLSPMAIKSWQS